MSADAPPANAADESADAAAAPVPAAEPGVPPGFRRSRAGAGFISLNGPLYFLHEGGQFKLGFRVEARHCNTMGICHGGMLATFADMLLPMGAIVQVKELHDRFLPTVSLQVDYIGPAKLGDWVEGEMQVLRTTRAMVFAQGLATSSGAVALRCSGVLKIGPLIDREALAAAGRI
ncbi:MAG: PaaI family thioesterase [Burkholderiales bacterium]|nr:PaaI family thioesterase [Burkholderiales bacterium]